MWQGVGTGVRIGIGGGFGLVRRHRMASRIVIAMRIGMIIDNERLLDGRR